MIYLTSAPQIFARRFSFAQALLTPPAPTPALERAFARRRKLLHSE